MKKTTKLLGVVSLLFATSFNVNAQCYTPLYEGEANLLPDAEMNDLSLWSGWGAGNRSLEVSGTEGNENVYCGTSSIKVGTGTCSTSLDYTINWVPNSTYRVRFMVKTIGGSGALEISGDADASTSFFVYDTQGEWQEMDYTFKTGENAVTAGIYINSCGGRSATSIYVDNYELYNISNIIPLAVSKTDLVFSEDSTEATFIVKGNGLASDIMLTAPTGITLDKTVITTAEASEGVTVTATFDGIETIINQDITVASLGVDPIVINVVGSVDSGCFIPLSSENNLVSDPILFKRSNFAGWGGVTIAVDEPGACGATSVLLTTDGVNTGYSSGAAFDYKEITLTANTQYRIRAMVKTEGGSIALNAIGIDGTFDGEGSSVKLINTFGNWEQIDYYFTTGANPQNVNISFNSADGGLRDGATGTVLVPTALKTFIDNYEIYDVSTLSSEEVAFNSSSVKISPNPVNDVLNIITGDKISKVTIYDVLGRVILSKDNQSSIDVSSLSSGSYIVNIVVGGTSQSLKFLK